MNTTDLPETFVVAMPDDALAPTIAKGTQLIFSTQEKPRPGVGVLVADQDGRRYVRRYAHNEPGTRFRLLADAINPECATLEIGRKKAQVLAVMIGRLDGTM